MALTKAYINNQHLDLLPFTSTLKEHDREFPLRSLAVKVTTCIPSENLCDVAVGEIPSGVTSMSGTSPSLSSAVIADQETILSVFPLSAMTDWSGGHSPLNSGFFLSINETRNKTQEY